MRRAVAWWLPHPTMQPDLEDWDVAKRCEKHATAKNYDELRTM